MSIHQIPQSDVILIDLLLPLSGGVNLTRWNCVISVTGINRNAKYYNIKLTLEFLHEDRSGNWSSANNCNGGLVSNSSLMGMFLNLKNLDKWRMHSEGPLYLAQADVTYVYVCM